MAKQASSSTKSVRPISERAATVTAKIVRNPKSSKATKTAAGAAMTQRPARSKEK